VPRYSFRFPYADQSGTAQTDYQGHTKQRPAPGRVEFPSLLSGMSWLRHRLRSRENRHSLALVRRGACMWPPTVHRVGTFPPVHRDITDVLGPLKRLSSPGKGPPGDSRHEVWVTKAAAGWVSSSESCGSGIAPEKFMVGEWQAAGTVAAGHVDQRAGAFGRAKPASRNASSSVGRDEMRWKSS